MSAARALSQANTHVLGSPQRDKLHTLLTPTRPWAGILPAFTRTHLTLPSLLSATGRLPMAAAALSGEQAVRDALLIPSGNTTISIIHLQNKPQKNFHFNLKFSICQP